MNGKRRIRAHIQEQTHQGEVKVLPYGMPSQETPDLALCEAIQLFGGVWSDGGQGGFVPADRVGAKLRQG